MIGSADVDLVFFLLVNLLSRKRDNFFDMSRKRFFDCSIRQKTWCALKLEEMEDPAESVELGRGPSRPSLFALWRLQSHAFE